MTDQIPDPPPTNGRDRLRELLDAVLDDDHDTLDRMARGAHASAFHFSRQLRRHTGEPPVSMRRRVMLERAAWQIGRGTSVTDAAFAAGYESVDGFGRAFSRAFGHPPSDTARDDTPAGTARGRTGHWLPAPNGVHFHPPTSLWIETGSASSGAPVTATMVEHDLADTRALLELAEGLTSEVWHRSRGAVQPMAWSPPEPSIAALLTAHLYTKEVWLAALTGSDSPGRPPDAGEPADLLEQHRRLVPAWLSFVRDVERRDAWDDAVVDALCDPPQSFVVGGILAHVLTYAAHRRLLVRQHLRGDGITVDDGDPLQWLIDRADPGPENTDPTDADPTTESGATP